MTASLDPIRVRIRQQDDKSGAYPTVLRTGDKRTGHLPVYFDDKNTIIFSGSVSYPSVLPTGSIHLKSNLTSSLVVNELKQIAIFSKPGISDILVDIPAIEEQFTPFVEDGLYEQSSGSTVDSFYLTGSRVEDVGLGFSSPLKNKTKIVIDLTPATASLFGFNEVGTHAAMFPMTYFNFSQKKWDRLGTGSLRTGLSVKNDTDLFLNNSTIGFGAGTAVPMTASHLHCNPVSTFGFPLHPKFHATSSQEYEISSSIQHPFLLEKFVYEFEAQLHIDDTSFRSINNNPVPIGIESKAGLFGAAISTFFILNQRRPFSSSLNYNTISHRKSTFSDHTVSASIPSNIKLSMGGGQVYVDTNRDLITYGQISSISAPANQTIQKQEGILREVNIEATSAYSFARQRFIMSGTIKECKKVDYLPGMIVGEYGLAGGLAERIISMSYVGGRNGMPVSNTGRDFVGAQTSNFLTNTEIVETYYANSASIVDETGFSSISKYSMPARPLDTNSPYLILPTDKLVFGWQCPVPTFVSSSINASGLKNSLIKGPRLEIHPGAGRLTLYGSLIKENTEYHDTLNQALTSNAVYEIINDGPILDQWENHPRGMLSGTYTDNIITGSLLTDVRGMSGRGIIGSNIGRYPNYTGEFLSVKFTPSFEVKKSYLGAQCHDYNELYYDSMMPKFDEIAKVHNVSVYHDVANDIAIIEVLSGSLRKWGKSGFPFESRYSSLKRNSFPVNNWLATKLYPSYLHTLSVSPKEIQHCAIDIWKNVNFYATDIDNVNIKFIRGNSLTIAPFSLDLKKTIFGIGDYGADVVVANSGITGDGVHNKISEARLETASANSSSIWSGVRPRGTRYGLSNLDNQYSRFIFSRNHYGFFRDIMEQREFTRFFIINKATDSVVETAFFTTGSIPSKVKSTLTDSSNKSQFLTASVPYFDGLSKN